MTASTEQERAEFEAWMHSDNPRYNPKDDSMRIRRDWVVWQAARRAPVVPQGWKPVPVEPTDAMLCALMQWDGETGLSILPQYQSMLAVAPQPPEAAQLDDINVVDMSQAVDLKEAAPVQLPEPVAYMLLDKDEPEAGFIFAKDSSAEWHGSEPLYTEQQVRQILAAAPQPPACNPSMQPELATKPPEAETDDLGIPKSCGKPLCRPSKHHPLCDLAAPVQLPEPWAVVHADRVHYSKTAWHGETPAGTKLYTETQVLQLLSRGAEKQQS